MIIWFVPTLCILLFVQQSYQSCERGNTIIICSNINESNVYGLLKEEVRLYPYVLGYRTTLTIKDSSIDILPTNFSSWSRFKVMRLEGSNIKRITPGAFGNQKSLEVLYLKDNYLRKINNGTFSTLINLKILDLQHNKIEEIEEHTFAGLNLLRILLLNNNNLRNLSNNLFDDMRSLNKLDLSHNNINMLDDTLFEGNINLTSLYLNNNNISGVPEYIFSNNLKLESLDLSYNPIKHVNYDMFLSLHDLSMINVSFTENHSVFSLNKTAFTRIRKLSLDGKNIREIHIFNRNITSLSLSQNNLSYINGTGFQHCTYLTYLNLSINNIDEIDRIAFFDLMSLRTLDLSNNKIQVLPHGLFSNLLNVQYLDISFNSLQTLTYGVFDTLRNLTYLDISSNEISFIAPFTLHSLRNLKEFHLDNNNIEYLDDRQITFQLFSLTTISFDNNLWTCSKLAKLVHALEIRHIKVIQGNISHRHNVNKIKCEDIVDLENENMNSSLLYLEMKRLVNNTFFNINDTFYTSNFYSFFNRGFRDTEFYHFFKNVMDKVNIIQTPNLTNTTDTSTNADKRMAFKLIDNENVKGVSCSRLEIVLYLIFITLLANLCFTMYRFFIKTTGRRNANCYTDGVVGSQTELV